MKNSLHALYQSFYSRELYRNAAYQWQGRGLGLLAWLALFITLSYVALALMFAGVYADYKEQVLAQAPVFTLDKNGLSIDRPSPHSITLEGHTIALIDTTSGMDANLEQLVQRMRSEQIPVFIGRDKMVTLKSSGEVSIRAFEATTEPFVVDRPAMEKFLRWMEIISLPLVGAVMFLTLWVYKMVQMLLYSLAALGVNALLKTRLPYAALQRITACALIPATLIGLAFSFGGVELPFLLSFACTLVFVAFGVQAARVRA